MISIDWALLHYTMGVFVQKCKNLVVNSPPALVAARYRFSPGSPTKHSWWPSARVSALPSLHRAPQKIERFSAKNDPLGGVEGDQA